MIGGVVTSAILELLLYPVIFVIWRRRSLPKDGREDHPEALHGGPADTAAPRPPRRSFVRFMVTALIVAALLGAGYYGWQKFGGKPSTAEASGAPFATQTVSGITVTLSHPEGQLRAAQNEVLIEFRNAAGELAEVGEVKFELDMNMPGMVMHSVSEIQRTGTGQYRARLKPGMGGDWVAKLSFDGPAGKGQTSFAVNVKP